MISKTEIYAAKHADLPGILQKLGIELVQNANSYHLRQHDSLKLFQKNGIWLYKWWSRGGEVGDGIQYLQRYLGMDFHEAVATLSCSSIVKPHTKRLPSHMAKEWQTKKWQMASQKLIEVAVSNLLGPNGKERFLYLVEQRGFYPRTILNHRLGWLPQKDNMPSKLLIPCYNSQGNLMRIRFRIDKPKKNKERYRIRKGSSPSSPFPLGVIHSKPLIIVESELDAILIAQEAEDLSAVLSLGTTGNKLTSAMICFIKEKIPLTMICLDNDDSGKMLTNRLLNDLSNAVAWPIPPGHGKDPGEAWKTMNIREWIEQGIMKHKKK